MAHRNYITHPIDGSLEVLHVQNGSAKTTIENTLPIAVDPGVVDVTGSSVAVVGSIVVDTAIPLDVTVTNPSLLPTGQPFAVRNSDLITVNNTTLPLLSVQHGGVGALALALRQWEVYNDGRDIAFLDLVLGGTLTVVATDQAGARSVQVACTLSWLEK